VDAAHAPDVPDGADAAAGPPQPGPGPSWRSRWFGSRDGLLAAAGLAVAVALVSAAAILPWTLHVWVDIVDTPPLHAAWMPRTGVGTVPALLLAAATVAFGPRLARRLSWRALLALAFAATLAWSISLALVDDPASFGRILDQADEYLPTARAVAAPDAFSGLLHDWVARMPETAPGSLPTHIAGHPAGALAVFVVLVAAGLGAPAAAGAVVTAIGATTPLAVLVALRALGAEPAARRAAPFLVATPAVIWMAVSADAVFAATAAWGLALLAIAASSFARRRAGERASAPAPRRHRATGTAGAASAFARRRPAAEPASAAERRRPTAGAAAVALAAGAVLGLGVELSYGIPLMGVLALAVLALARSWRPLPWAVAGALAVVAGFALAGFRWWEAYPALTSRYWEGLAHLRPGEYWTWANVAVLCVAAGPIVAVGTALALGRTGALLSGLRSRLRAGVRPDPRSDDRPEVRLEVLRGRRPARRSDRRSVRPSSALGPGRAYASAGPRPSDALSEPGLSAPALPRPDRVVVVLALAALVVVLLATSSQLTRAETERIWLPFMPWLLVSTALLPDRWTRPALALQVAVALVVQHLFFTYW